MGLTIDPLPESFGRASFSGVDVEVYAFLAGATPDVQSKPYHLDSVQVFTISIFREKIPVRSLGHTNVLSYTNGPRTFAGTLISTIIEKHPLYDLLMQGWEGLSPVWDQPPNKGHGFSYDEHARHITHDRRFMPDSLPPINFLLKFSNELGNTAAMVVYGVEFTHDGTTMSIEDIFTENTFQYVARDALVLFAPVSKYRSNIPTSHVPRTAAIPSVWLPEDAFNWIAEGGKMAEYGIVAGESRRVEGGSFVPDWIDLINPSELMTIATSITADSYASSNNLSIEESVYNPKQQRQEVPWPIIPAESYTTPRNK